MAASEPAAGSARQTGTEEQRCDILERSRAYEGFFKLELLTIRHTRFDGDWTPPLRRELLIQRNAVTILPFDPVRDTVLLIEQLRPGAIDDPAGPWLLEAAAGLIEPGEGIEATARRELIEECGIERADLIHALDYRPSPGATTERVAVFIGLAELPEHGSVFGVADEHEDIRTHIMPAEAAFALLRDGAITASTAVISLLWLEINRARLRRGAAAPDA